MRVKMMGILFFVVLFSSVNSSKVNASVFLHEFLADPAADLAGDANNDGVRDSYDDEFIEIYNSGPGLVDLSGWRLNDAEETRHVFASGISIFPGELIVVFGGGNPNLESAHAFIASTGILRLNNRGDTILLSDADGNLVDFYAYGSEAGNDQSLVRSPERIKGEWVEHTALPNADGKLFSPGSFVNENISPVQRTVPEPGTFLSLMLGVGTVFIIRKKN